MVIVKLGEEGGKKIYILHLFTQSCTQPERWAFDNRKSGLTINIWKSQICGSAQKRSKAEFLFFFQIIQKMGSACSRNKKIKLNDQNGMQL